MAELHWLGLHWDAQPLRQSQRFARYDQQLQQLLDAGAAYPCFCTPAQLEATRRAQLAAGQPPRYAGTCRHLALAERAARLAAGEAASVRFAVPQQGSVASDDLVHGPRSVPVTELGDFVLRRADGSPAFFFCNAIDDADSGVTHALRGDDHLSNTPRQLLILSALGRSAPRYGHLALLTGPDGSPLSKRHGAASLRQLREEGFVPAAVANLLFRLGHSTTESALLDADAMARAFGPAHLQRAPAQFDPAQLLHWQREALTALTPHDAAIWLGPQLPVDLPPAQREAFVAAVLPNVLRPHEAAYWVQVVFGDAPAADAEAQAAIAAASPGLFAAAAAAAALHPQEFKAIADAAKAATGAKGPALFKPLRAALTGRLQGPELGPLLRAFADDVARQRLQRFT
jgi:glutamyl-tRNA synthetase